MFRPAVASSALEGVTSGHQSMVGWDGFPWRGKGRHLTMEAEEAQQTTAIEGTPNQPSRMGLNFVPSQGVEPVDPQCPLTANHVVDALQSHFSKLATLCADFSRRNTMVTDPFLAMSDLDGARELTKQYTHVHRQPPLPSCKRASQKQAFVCPRRVLEMYLGKQKQRYHRALS